jgi:hypothetical protein
MNKTSVAMCEVMSKVRRPFERNSVSRLVAFAFSAVMLSLSGIVLSGAALTLTASRTFARAITESCGSGAAMKKAAYPSA